MIGSRAWRALMRRNLIYRKRNWIGTIFEFILPIGFVAILVGIKVSVQGTSSFAPRTIPPFIPSNVVTWTPLSFADYVTTIQAQRVCIEAPTKPGKFNITGIYDGGYNWQVPFVKCDSRQCTTNGQDAREFCEYAQIGLAPSSSSDTGGMERALDFANYIYDTYPALQPSSTTLPFSFDVIRMFDNPQEMDTYVQSSDYGVYPTNPKLAMGIVWEGNATDAYLYSLRQNSTNFNSPEEEGRPASITTPDTSQLFASYAKTDTVCATRGGTADQGPLENSCTGQYMYNGVLTFLRLVGDYVLDRTGSAAAGYNVAEAGVQYVQFPTREFTQDGFYATIQVYGPLLVVLGLLYPVAAMIAYVTREKELRQKELMKMMSVVESDIGWAWFISFYSFYFLVACVTTGVSTALYENSAPIYLFVFWIFTFLAIVVYCMVVATLTSKTTRAVLIGLLIFFIGVFLTLAVDYQTGSGGLIRLISLHPVAAFSYGLQEIGRLEDLGIGVQRSTAGSTDSTSGYTFNTSISMLILDSVLWGFVTFYLNRVIKPDYGQALPLWFPFTSSYWCPGRSVAPQEEDDKEPVNDGIPFEPVGNTLLRQKEQGESIEIRGLRKTFGEKTAVDNLSLSMYSGHITALLGHNGAGKTTTIGCLTGALAPTEGYATIAGKDTRTQMSQIREDIGICLQHDCLFPLMTVREHVQFFARIKGLYANNTKEEAEAHVDQAIQDVALAEKRNTLSKNLSGGMKRKLSVAIAFCGGSKVVLLDEPTSGMDPFSRRFTWNVIRNYRQGRCIILTTHFMDEADILGDRIAIMAEGQLRCAGSSLFLKKTYGVGYQLTIERGKKKDEAGDAVSDEGIDMDEMFELQEKAQTAGIVTKEELNDNFSDDGIDMDAVFEASAHFHPEDDKLMSIVTDAVKDASLLSNVGSELSYQLPVGAASQFAPMFEGLDREVEAGTISSYGVSITTLDEVFLLVARGGEAEKSEFASASVKASAAALYDPEKSTRSRMDLENEGLFMTHLGALFRKRAANFRRDKKAWDLQPLILTLADYNPDVTVSPRNPIPFNTPDDLPFTCQPGICSYMPPLWIGADEAYSFCGLRGRLGNVDVTSGINGGANYSCSLSESAMITGRIIDDGAFPQGSSVVDNITTGSLSLTATSSTYAASQYAGLWYSHDQFSVINETGALYNSTVINLCNSRPTGNFSSTTCSDFDGVGYVIQYNYTAIHVSPLYQVVADEALVRQARNDDNFTMQCTIDPLPITSVESSFKESENAFAAWFLVVLSFPFIAGAFATFVVSERQSKAKHLQTVAGVKPSSYWVSTYLWDILNYQIPLWITVILMFAFGVEVLTTSNNDVVSGVIITLLLFGPASAAFTYCLSFGFTSASLCNVVVIISAFLIGLGGPLAVFILTLIGNDRGNPQQSLISAANVVTWILRFVPAFNLGKGLFYAINIEAIIGLEGRQLSVWSPEVLLIEVVFLAWESVVYLALAIQIDKWSTNPRAVSYWRSFIRFITCRCCCRSQTMEGDAITIAIPDDDDVVDEQDRVLAGKANDDLIVANQLTKRYDNGKLAVNNLSFGIPPGECFGLLGINGAGKTSTMAMLTAEFPPTSGDATLAGFSVRNEPEKTRRRIGYCPQFDAHFANMTGREHVELYAAIKGVPKEFVKPAAAAKLKEVGLSDADSDRLSAGYSGGMKRRLSLACAMIGQPQIVFLDECSTGVDPVARREIWQLISDMVAGGNIPEEERTSVILTTHSMEECEALCPRIGIMANGRLRCLGSAQHLKNKFGQGFQVELKVKLVDEEDEDYIANLTALAQFKASHSVGASMKSQPAAEAGEETNKDEERASAVVSSEAQDTFFNLDETMEALKSLLEGDDHLASKVSTDDPDGYGIWRDATSPVGVTLDGLAAFATTELRMRALDLFIKESYPNHILRERQDTKARYEVSSQGVRIANIFSELEQRKDTLRLADYGVSQTSLEQVFNMHAAEAEKLKQGRNDG